MWIPFSLKLPHPCTRILVMHPNWKEPNLAYSGTRPADYREDGYSYWMKIPDVPTTEDNLV